jgi:transcription elongation factor GreA
MEEKISLTKEGYTKLKKELDYLINKRRIEISRRIGEAKAFGDLMENSEYNDAKREQAFVEGRILEIKRVLKNSSIIDKNLNNDKVEIGTTVILKEINTNQINEFQLVSSIEVDPLEGKISLYAPVGEAIYHKRIGDRVKVKTPIGEFKYEIMEIR